MCSPARGLEAAVCFRAPEDVVRWLRDVGARLITNQPCVLVLYIETDGRCERLSRLAGRLDGLVDAVQLGAICYHPHAVVVVASRPGDGTAPTRCDGHVLARMGETLRDVGVAVLDLLIVDDHRWRSLAGLAATNRRP